MIPDREKFVVRMPSNLHKKIKRTANNGKRSMNNEIVDRLEKSFSAHHSNHFDDQIKSILLQNIDELKRQIEIMATEVKP
jgi:hypothetical protein